MPSLALLLPFLAFGPNLGAWPDCGSPWSISMPPYLGKDQVAPLSSPYIGHMADDMGIGLDDILININT